MSLYWLASYPKSGNTWFISFLKNYLRNEAAPLSLRETGLDYIASSRAWMDEALGFGSGELSEEEILRLRPAVYRWAGMSRDTTYHKVHDAYIMLPSGEPLFPLEGMLGAIYILRNPLDVAVSYSHYYHCSLDKAIEDMGRNLSMSPSNNARMNSQVRQRLLTWSQHVGSWSDAPGVRVEVVRYEDMKNSPMQTFSRAVRFLGFPDDDERLARAIRHSGFDELKTQEAEAGFPGLLPGVQCFFRKGVIGDWKNVLSNAQVEKIIADHGDVMQRFGYLDEQGRLVDFDE